jgi:hypothetical protein
MLYSKLVFNNQYIMIKDKIISIQTSKKIL